MPKFPSTMRPANTIAATERYHRSQGPPSQAPSPPAFLPVPRDDTKRGKSEPMFRITFRHRVLGCAPSLLQILYEPSLELVSSDLEIFAPWSTPDILSWTFDWPGLRLRKPYVMRFRGEGSPRRIEVAREIAKVLLETIQDQPVLLHLSQNFDRYPAGDAERYRLQNVDLSRLRLESFEYYPDLDHWCPRFTYAA